jgi:hypothetical protein
LKGCSTLDNPKEGGYLGKTVKEVWNKKGMFGNNEIRILGV